MISGMCLAWNKGINKEYRDGNLHFAYVSYVFVSVTYIVEC